MEKQKLVKVYKAENGFRVNWPTGLFGLVKGRDVFYSKGFSGTKLPKDRFVVVEGPAIYDSNENLLLPNINCHPRVRPDYNLLDVRGQEKEAMKVCKDRAYEIAREKAGSRYDIKQLERIVGFI
ncbi:hypothetical protein KAT36_01255 [Candidatus Pacearchaeota archaeon]|nr:hypothetical protein [Candidatus Pacearchaeota archaeon]